jgi:RNA polymerase sigma-70 factor (ECF subfamily)
VPEWREADHEYRGDERWTRDGRRPTDRADVARDGGATAGVRAPADRRPEPGRRPRREILLRIHQNVDSLEDRERLPNWVFRIARNAIIDEYRRAGRSREQLVPALGDEVAEAPTDEDDPGVLSELAECLRPLLAGLPVEQRRAVEMIDLDGVTQAGAAEREGISLSGMKSRVQRGRKRLAELLGQCCALTLDGRGLPMEYQAPPDCGCAGH